MTVDPFMGKKPLREKQNEKAVLFTVVEVDEAVVK